MDSASELGPDYFGYYTQEVAELVLQDKDLIPCSPKNPECVVKAKGVVKEKDVCKHDHTGNGITSSIDTPFCDAAGAKLSDIKKETLRTILRQSVVVLSREVDEMFDPVINMCRIKSRIRQEKTSSHRMSATREEDAENHPRKKPKLFSSSSSLSIPLDDSPTGKVIDDLQILLENIGEDRIMKHSDILSTTLDGMQQKLEELLDVVMSSCRPMTHVEKHQLCTLIKNLPPENLNRVVEILRPRNPSDEKSVEEINVNLEHENNLTLWRLYYYVQAFENAKKLRQKSSSCI